MAVKIINKFSNLPVELINKIINYTDVIVYRHGKYINRINKQDYKYAILYTIPKPKKIGNYCVELCLLVFNYKFKETKGYFIEYDFKNGLFAVTIKFVKKEIDGFDKYFDVITCERYIFDANSMWRKTPNYIM